ncbi:MAG: Coenzyme F420 hydrogenase/dehydrogenase, beta subunit C-terminal domain [Bacilli bacterium]
MKPKFDQTINNIQFCTGCGLCAHLCPKDAIKIIEDPRRRHFLFPVIDKEKCINCGLCFQGCPVHKEKKLDLDTKVYHFRHEDKNKLKESSSGGAFQKIAEIFLTKENVAVYGAAWSGLKVQHQRITSLDDLSLLLGSKYIQSLVDKNIYTSIKQDVKDGKEVLFSGTPCQVAAVHALLNEQEREKVLLIELLCHGVPNQWGFDRCIEQENKVIKGEIISFDFRHKTAYEKDNRQFSYVYQKENKNYEVVGQYFFFPYYYFFHSYSIYRDSCYQCNFRNNRLGDIIIGDFWGASKLDKTLPNDWDRSIMIPLTFKGEDIVHSIGTKKDIPVADISIYNESLLFDSKKDSGFVDFYEKIENLKYYKKKRINPHYLKFKIILRNTVKFCINLFLPKKQKKNYTKIVHFKNKIPN